MKGRSKLLSPLMLIVMLFSLVAGAITTVSISQPALADDPDDPYFSGITGAIYTTPRSAYTGYLDADLDGSNSGITSGVYCLEFDFDLQIPAWSDWPALSTTGHFEGYATFHSSTPGLELYGEITLNYPCTVPYGSSTVTGGKITLYSSPTSAIIPGYPNSYLNLYYWWGRSVTTPITMTNGNLTKCPALDVSVSYVGPSSGTQVNDTFKAEAYVANLGTATATNVVAHIDIYGDASLVPGDNADKYLGDMGPGWSENAVWTLQCDESGDVLVVVTVTSDEGSCSGWDENRAYLEVSQDESVEPVLEVWLDEGQPTEETFSTEQKFDIEIDVKNNGDVTLTNVTVGYTCDGLVSPLTNSTVIASLAPGWGGKVDVNFENVTCTAAGLTSIRAWAQAQVGNETLYDGDSSWFVQEAKAHLKAELTVPWGDTISVCDDFPVTVFVSNTGEAEACAMVTVNVTGNVTPSGNLTTPPGTLYPIPGGEARYYTWNMHCTDVGDVVMTVVDLYGWDHNTWELVPAENIDPLPAPATVHQVLIPLEVEIESYPSSVSVCDDFIINAQISSYGCVETDVTGVWATINIDGPASLTPNETATKYIGDVLYSGRSDYKVVGWTLHCDGYGPVNITVTAAGTCTYTNNATATTSDPVTVTQYGAVLEVVGWGQPLWVWVDSYFTIQANVTNTGNGMAYYVTPNLTIDDPELAHVVSYPSSVNIAAGSSVWFTWGLDCDEAGTIIVNVTPAGWEDSLKITPIPDRDIYPDEIEVVQKPTLIVDITSCIDTILPGTNFTVTARVLNYAGCDVPSVYAFIYIDGPASLVAGEEEVQYLGTVTTDWPPDADHGYQEVSWTLHCDAPGPVCIVVYPGVVPDYGEINLVEDEIEVCQAELVVNIVIPQDGTAVNTGQTFAVKATVTNISNETINPVFASIDTGELASLVNGETECKRLGLFNPGTTEQVSWTLQCDCEGDTVITVDAEGDVCGNPDGRDACVLSDSVTVHQNLDACLSVVVDAPAKTPVGCDFTVTATISNTGDIAATGVNATITLPDGVVLVSPGETINVGTIAGGGSKVATWTVECNATETGGLVSVEATGNSALTGEDISPALDSAPVSQYDYLYVLITEPAAGDIFSSEQDFDVTAAVYNCLDTAITDVNVTITVGGAVQLVSPDPTQTISTICPLTCPNPCFRDVTWLVHCTGAGEGTISVSAVSSDGVGCDTDNIAVNQVAKAHLVGNIFFPDGDDSFCALQEFHVKASVENTGTATATDVTATLVLEGNAEVVSANPYIVGTIAGGVEVPIMWTVECTGAGVVTINIDLAGKDINTGAAIPEENIVNSCQVEVNQLPLAVQITAPQSSTTFSVYQDFYVNALVTNSGTATIEDVVASIGIIPYPIATGGYADVADGEDYNKDLGDIRGGETHDVTWALHCEGSGDVMILVVASVEGTDAQIASAPVIVHQQCRPEPVVIIESPADETYIATGQEFMVTAKIYNGGEATLTDVTATISIPWYDWDEFSGIPAPLSVVSPDATQSVSDIPGESYAFVSWTLRCDWAAEVPWGDELTWADIVVTVVGYDPNHGDQLTAESQEVEIACYPAAHLVVDITAPEDGSIYATGQSFDITATVTNTGFADAWGVNVTISFDSKSLGLTEGGYTQDVGNLAGHSQDGNATVTWHVYCKDVGSTTITVTAAGYDEFGYHWEQTGSYSEGWENYWDEGYYYYWQENLRYVWDFVSYPGVPILAMFIEPDSITVKQVETLSPANLALVISYPSEVYAGEDFAVTAVVTNTGETSASNVSVTLSVVGPASIDGLFSRTITTIAAGNSATVRWDLHCDGKGGVTVTVTASGTGLNTAVDSGAVQQVAGPAGWGPLIGGIVGGLALLGIIICVGFWRWLHPRP